MAPKEKRTKKKKTKTKARVKKDQGPFKPNDKHVIRTGHVVFVGRVPSALCVSESTVRDYFAVYGTLLSVTIHHNFLDMEPDGFLYLEYEEKEEAEAAVAAVKQKAVGLTVYKPKDRKLVHPSIITGMHAALALRRGEPRLEVDEETKDLLLGRQEGNRFSQSQQGQAMDEEDLILQSLSQHSFAHSQPKKKKKKKRRRASDADVGVDASPKPKKKAKKSKRSNKVAIPTE
ncbi:hypothetical protein PF005_g23508 [Phytophthora fragariae]|uniref:RRM domain-containing protein n=1 Tax=Phytophthora fragariae TaxID=53985 RepID=A0A6A3X156_9STRA|nr:hypothetical protein PF003_g25931 [Phytophthora fragariae]KAE8925650.1 hypothetical protein PF009_g24149 [Phytophthora fragariae]KAE8981082.1 hypothetical protein PF011_g22171 [Phytophthora fragariae]KAE9076071.1 hypothetical protein PF010_g24050 [Phytophthora fragariae]KAE9079286.1 hypothetical protein PF007_g23514 [Phytophthora fragariae]